MTAQHTPGPWDCEVRKPAGITWDGIIRWSRNRDPICSVFMAGYMAKEAEANARLIAAAPELLAALERLSAGMDSSNDSRPLVKAGEIRAARAAIAKAKERS